MDDFTNSFITKGGSTGGLCARQTGNDAGVGLFLHDPSQVSARVPNSLVLSAANLLQQWSAAFPQAVAAMEDFASSHPTHVSDRTVHVSYLLFGRMAEQCSPAVQVPLQEYLRILPRSLTTPVFYSEEEQYLLEGTSLQVATQAKLTKLFAEFETLHPLMLQLQATLGNESSATSEPPVDFDDFRWADGVYWSRVLELPQHPHPNIVLPHADLQRIASESTRCMVPFLDFANHSFAPNIRWSLDNGSTGDINIEIFGSATPPTVGEQLCISYGQDKPNHELLFLHGFTVPDNANRVARLNVMPELQELLCNEAGAVSPRGLLVRLLQLSPMLVVEPPRARSATSSVTGKLSECLAIDSVLLTAIVALPDDIDLQVDLAQEAEVLVGRAFQLPHDRQQLIDAILAAASTCGARMLEFVGTVAERQLEGLHASDYLIDAESGVCTVTWPQLNTSVKVSATVARYVKIFRDEQASVVKALLEFCSLQQQQQQPPLQ
ncbi:hypothetical protein RI367_002230 [Sorochytrium milnesiophthora]